MIWPFHNPATQDEKAAQLGNEAKLRPGDHEPTTLHQLAQLGDTSLGGRFAADGVVSGTKPFVDYPAAATGPYGGPQPGIEPPFPTDISFVEPVGTFAEVQRSLEEFVEETATAAPQGDVVVSILGDPALAVASSAAGEAEPAAPLPVPGGVMRGSANLPAEAAHSRLQELLSRGLVRRTVRRRKLP